MTTQLARERDRSRLVLAALVVAAVLGSRRVLRGDDVSLIPGTTVKQAIGGRVRGQVQSESPTEVVVLLGANPITVPTDQIVSIRYDGQSASFQLAEARESTGQLAEAAELFKKAATEAAGRPFPQQAALFREAQALGDLALVEPDRIKEARDKLEPVHPSLSQQPPHRRGPRGLARLQIHCRRFRGRRGDDRDAWPRCPRPANGPPCSAPRCWPSRGSTTRRSPSWTA